MPRYIEFEGKLIDVDVTLRELDRWDYEESLGLYLRKAWTYIDPAPFIDGWCIDALAEHLQAVVDGEIRWLLINQPPRTNKSLMCSVAFPSWVWAQRYKTHTSGPGVKFLHASYADKLSLRDSVRCRRLIESPWYQSYWADRFKLSGDQNAKHRFSNDQGGERLITSIGAGVTGEGFGIGIVDDGNASNEVKSDAATESVIEWYDGTLSTRYNDPKRSALICVQQRLAQNDLSGHILEKDGGKFVHLCLPMRYEADRSFVTAIGWQDPRTVEGELLWPERFGEKEVKDLERTLGPWQSSGQLQQSPMPKGGGIIRREWWLKWEGKEFPGCSYILATADLAYTEKTENDYSAITVWGVFAEDTVGTFPSQGFRGEAKSMQVAIPNPKVILLDAWHDRLPLHELVERLAKTCIARKVDKLRIENKGPGISVSQEMRRLFSNEGFAIECFDPGNQDKMARLYSIQHIFAEGMVYAGDKDYVELVIGECEIFPKGKHDDLADTVSASLKYLRDLGLLQRAPEVRSDIEADMRIETTRAPTKLYPG